MKHNYEPNNESDDCDLLEVLHPHWTLFTIGLVEHDGDARFGDACLALLIDEVLLRPSGNLQNTNFTIYILFPTISDYSYFSY